MYLANYWALAIVVPGVLAIALSLHRRGYSRRQAIGVAVLRTVTLAVVVLVLGDMHLSMRSARRHHVFLIDVSDSFKPNDNLAEDFTRRQIERIPASDRVTTIAFAGETAVTYQGFGGKAPERILPEKDLSTSNRTDLGRALETAASVIDATESAAVYLITDGLTTEPVDPGLTGRLASRGIAVNALATRPGYSADLRLLKATGPESVAAGGAFEIEAMVYSEVDGPAEVRVSGPGTEATARVELRGGVPTTATLAAKGPEAGLGEYVVMVSGTPDPVAENDRLKLAVLATGKPEIVVVGEAGSAMEKIARAMEGFSVRTETPEPGRALGMDPAKLAGAELVVIDNVATERIGQASMRTIKSYVEGGGGLVMVGGPRSFAGGGWSGTETETVLPVWCDPRDAEKQPMTLVLVLDASGSMSEGNPSKIELARRAALVAVTALKEKDVVGVTAFRMKPEALVKIGPPAPMGPLREAIMSLNASGGTDMYPALLGSITEAAKTDKPLKHLLVLSDGKSQPGNIEAVRAALAEAKVSLSAVVTGEEADKEVLNKLATESGGRFYEVKQMSELSGIFLDDLRRVEGPLTRSGKPFAIKTISALPFAGGAPGTVFGYNRVRVKNGSTVIWETEPEPGKTEPVLVIGQSGLGRSAALMTAPGTEWTADANSHPELGTTLAGLMKYLARNADATEYQTSVQSEGGKLVLTVEAAHEGEPINGKHLRLELQSPEEGTRTLEAVQTGPGRYSAKAGLNPWETAVGVVFDADTGKVLNTRVVSMDYPPEYRRFTPDLSALGEMAHATGGKVFTEPEQVSRSVTSPARVYESVRWTLVMVLIVLFMIEACLRAFGRI